MELRCHALKCYILIIVLDKIKHGGQAFILCPIVLCNLR